MLRLDVSVADGDAEGYDVPPTNPFVGQAGVLGEIWSFGLRNPWRWSFDYSVRGGTGALVIADVGQNAWEEVNYEPAGLHGQRLPAGRAGYVGSRAPPASAVGPADRPSRPPNRHDPIHDHRSDSVGGARWSVAFERRDDPDLVPAWTAEAMFRLWNTTGPGNVRVVTWR